jgi:nucleotide-binding universal stress UspA family protein
MSFESLLIYFEADREQANLVRVAADITTKFESSVIGLSALGIRPPFVADGIVIDAGGEIEVEQMRGLLATRESWFRRTAGKADGTVEWRSGLESPTQRLIREASAADLIIMSPVRTFRDAYRHPDVGEVILNAGRPVLVVPDEADGLKADRIVIGWKDTREARRAVQDALPFLNRSSEVTIVEVCERSDEEAARAEAAVVRQYLDKHGVNCSYEFILRPSGPVGQQLVTVAHQIKADLIVAGGYGHTRLGEWVFGGATRDLLMESDVCCLMSH